MATIMLLPVSTASLLSNGTEIAARFPARKSSMLFGKALRIRAPALANSFTLKFAPRLGSSNSLVSGRRLSVEASFAKEPKKVLTRETVVPAPDYRAALILLGAAGALIYADNLLPAAPIGLLGLLLLVQTTRVRFVFDSEALEVKVGEELKESGENVFVGGKNCWKYSTFVNWELWWPNFPVLVYFKETQTKPEGQVHFFPVIFDGKQLYNVLVERGGPSKTSGPQE